MKRRGGVEGRWTKAGSLNTMTLAEGAPCQGAGHAIVAPARLRWPAPSPTWPTGWTAASAARAAPAAAAASSSPGPPHRHLLVPRRRHHATTSARPTSPSAPSAATPSTWPSPSCAPSSRCSTRKRLLLAIDDTPTAALRPRGRGRRHPPQPHPRARPARSTSTATSGSPWPPWPSTPTGAPSPCPCRPSSTSAQATCAKLPPERRRALPHQAGAGRRAAALAEALGGQRLRAALGGRSMAATPSGRSCGRPGRPASWWSAACARTPPCGRCRRPERRPGQRGPLPTYGKKRHQPGQAGRADARLAAGGVRAVRREGDQDDQDVPGDVAPGRRA